MDLYEQEKADLEEEEGEEEVIKQVISKFIYNL